MTCQDADISCPKVETKISWLKTRHRRPKFVFVGDESIGAASVAASVGTHGIPIGVGGRCPTLPRLRVVCVLAARTWLVSLIPQLWLFFFFFVFQKNFRFVFHSTQCKKQRGALWIFDCHRRKYWRPMADPWRFISELWDLVPYFDSKILS